jgi:hypothetical protein
MTYTPGICHERTEAERNDEQLSWSRSDVAFFAAGACHILAWQFIAGYPDDGFEIIHIRPRAPHDRGHHVYVTNGAQAFDFAGWTEERELLEVHRSAYAEVLPGWDFDRVVVDTDLETFCRNNAHRLPSQFAHDPRPRAAQYLAAAAPGPA